MILLHFLSVLEVNVQYLVQKHFFRSYSVLMRQGIFIVRGVNDNSRADV